MSRDWREVAAVARSAGSAKARVLPCRQREDRGAGGGGAAEGEQQHGLLMLCQTSLLHSGGVQGPGDGRQALQAAGGQGHLVQVNFLEHRGVKAGQEGVGLLRGELAAGEVDPGDSGGGDQEQGRRRPGAG